jgi:GntR family transcriptional regulator
MELTIDRESQQKLYVQIYSIIKERIERGDWPEGTRIPTEEELCRTYDVSKATVRIAVSELVREGYLRKQQGKGTFVTSATNHLGLDMRTRLTENMFGEGVRTKKEVLVRREQEPPADVMAHLGLEGAVCYVLCKRTVEGVPVYLEEIFFPISLFPGIEDEDIGQTPFYMLVKERASRRISRVMQTIEVIDIGDEAAGVLNMKKGDSALLIHRLLIGPHGEPLAYTRLTGSGRGYKIQTEFERIK